MLCVCSVYVLFTFLTIKSSNGGGNSMHTFQIWRDLAALSAMAMAGYAFLLVT